MTWDTEFDVSLYNLSDRVLALGEDTSWHNDVSPSVGVMFDRADGTTVAELRLFVDCTDPAHRGAPDEPRFMVSVLSWTDLGQLLLDRAEIDDESCYYTDDETEASAVFEWACALIGAQCPPLLLTYGPRRDCPVCGAGPFGGDETVTVDEILADHAARFHPEQVS